MKWFNKKTRKNEPCKNCKCNLNKEIDYGKCGSCGFNFCFKCIYDFTKPDDGVEVIARVCKKCIDFSYEFMEWKK